MTTVVFLLSDKRSGSTFFERELARHPGIQHVCSTPHTYNETHYWVKAALLLSMPEVLFSDHHFPRSYGGYSQVRKSLIAGVRDNVTDFKAPEDDRELVFKGWEALCEQFATPVFIEKSPQHPHHWAALELMLQWAERTHHQVKFVGLIRNPMSVMYSAFRLSHTPAEQRQYSWFNANRNLLLLQEMLDDRWFLWVRYEDMISHPAREFERVCSFIGVIYDPVIGHSAHTKSRNIWREDLTYTLQLDPAVKRLAQHFGYVEKELFNPLKPPQVASQRAIHRVRMMLHRSYSRLYNLYKRTRLK